ncbi:tRNA 2-thiouridine(34) synthase MnmA, partial [Candidatus Nomurabacteria bacterium]|nr:tRNA 2-thiouridine(34) synthase MnmA [Candidatus Nomurabacteria bacterium]
MGKKINKTVFVGVSGGVDSSVSAALLKDQGYNVVGVFIRTWQPDFIECTWRDERRDAMRVCAHLGIPFLECDAEDAYKKGVADYMIEEYKKGHTPNPDVMCNREVKFGVFWDFAKKHGADFIATGHYAQISRKQKVVSSKEILELEKGEDESKDQSYFLWTLTQDDLAHTLFPIGHLQKTEVRKLAEKYKLPTATKKDSQGVCFLGPLDMKDFLKHYIPEQKGDVVDENGKVIGYHDGAVFFTLGERHGFTITEHSTNGQSLYIVDKDIDKNTICVSPRQGLGLSSQKEYELYNVNLNLNVDVIKANENKEYTAQIRYHGEL